MSMFFTNTICDPIVHMKITIMAVLFAHAIADNVYAGTVVNYLHYSHLASGLLICNNNNYLQVMALQLGIGSLHM